MHPIPHLYGRVYQLWGVSVYSTGHPVWHRVDMRKWDRKTYLDPRGMSREIARKTTREGYCRTLLLQSPVGSSPDCLEGLLFLLIFKGLWFTFTRSEQIVNTTARTREALPPARCGLDSRPQESKALANTAAQGQAPYVFLGWQGNPNS